MCEIELRRAEDADVPRIMEIMDAAQAAMADPSAYITDPEDYVQAHVRDKGFIVLARVDGVIAGFFMTVLPAWVPENTGYCLDFPPEELAATGILDSVAVDPAYQGMGLMGRMLGAAMRELTPGCRTLVATVAPNNAPSLRNFQARGFVPEKEIVKPSGQRRYLMVWRAAESC